MRTSVRGLALFLLPASLLAASTYVAAGLTLVLLLCTPNRRRVRVATPVFGVLAAGVLAAVQALAADTLGVRGASLLAGPLGTLLLWFAIAALLLVIYASLSPIDAPVISLGSIIAAIAGGAFALFQVAVLGATQATLFAFHPNLTAAGFIAVCGGILVGFGRVWQRHWAWRILAVSGVVTGLVGLVLTGSRSGLVGAAFGGLALLILVVVRVRAASLLLSVVAIVVVGLGLGLVDRSLRGPPTANALANSGFEQGLLPWTLAGGSVRVAVNDRDGPGTEMAGEGSQADGLNAYAVMLRRDSTAIHSLARHLGALPVPMDQTGGPTEATLSLDVKPSQPEASIADTPSPDRPAADATAPLRVVVAIDALDADGTLVSRLGIEGWTAEPTDNMSTVGGRPRLPADPVDEWHRHVVPVPPAPSGSTTLRLELQPADSAIGAYGLIDNVMLAPASAGTAYIPGQRPGLFTFLAPATSRLQQLRQPFAASGGRVSMWLLGLELAAARPILGYGPGSERALTQEYAAERVRRPLQHFHSFYLRLLLEGGSVLLATVLVMIGYLLVAGVRGGLQGAPGSAVLVATTVALLVQSFFDPVLAFGEVVGGLWLIVAVANTQLAAAEPT